GGFDSLPLFYDFRFPGAPFVKVGTASNLPPGSFPHRAPAFLTPNSFDFNFVEHKPRRNYVLQWNLNVQREITSNLTAIIGYVGSSGVHNSTNIDDADTVIPTRTSAGYLFPNPIGSGTKINPSAGSIRFMGFRGHSAYHGLVMGISKKMSRGLQVQGSYTWGKSIDDGS